MNNTKNTNLKVKPLTENMIDVVATLDELSDRDVASMIDCEDYGWGLFDGEKLIGYCTIGYADVIEDDISEYPGYCCDSLLLSDVFILPEYRGCEYSLKLVDEAIKTYTENDKQLVFLTLLDRDLVKHYEKIGFKEIYDYIMVRDER